MTHPEDTATIERDLHAVEAALTAGTAMHDDPVARELQELALALRADAPQADAGFADALRARVEAGFPREHGFAGRLRARFAGGRKPESAQERQQAALARIAARSARKPTRVRAVLLPVAGVGAPLVLVVALVLAGGGPSSDDGDAGGGGGGAAMLERAPGDASAGAVESAPDAAAAERGGTPVVPAEPLPPPGGFAPGRRERKIERSISMTLEAPDDEIAAVADGVTRVTGRYGGFVLRSDLNTGEDGASGTFELRIPSARLQPALRDLSGLATVRSQTQSGQDVTREHVTAKDRLQAARAERRSLLRRLENADTDEEAEAIRRRLDLVAGEINGLRGQLRDLRLRTDYAIVSVELSGEEGDSGAAGAGGSFDDALGDAGDLLVGTAGVLIRILALALPLGLVALAAWLAARGLRRRRRESALA